MGAAPPHPGHDTATDETATSTTVAKHPAKFSEPILVAMFHRIAGEQQDRDAELYVLDPFAGVGGIHHLKSAMPGRVETFAVELEPEWAAQAALLGETLSLIHI